ncbi:Myb-like DNA-binding domain protein, partial [Quaeritorhiza haematococci]
FTTRNLTTETKQVTETATGEGRRYGGTVEISGSLETLVPRRRRWTEQEDERLREGIQVYGQGKWKQIGCLVGTRTAQDCSSRWIRYVAPNIKKEPWSNKDDELLISGIEQHGVGAWTAISALLSGRTARQCRIRWVQLSDTYVIGPWTRTEDLFLRTLVEKYKVGRWTDIASKMPGRTARQCRQRWMEYLNPKITKGKWMEEENALLKEAVQLYGENKWSVVAQLVKTRTASQCRQRWKFSLSSKISTKKWTEEEDRLLAEAIREYGQ